MGSIQFPEEFLEKLNDFFSLDSKKLLGISKALESQKPSLSFSEYANNIEKLGIDIDVKDAINVLVTLYRAKNALDKPLDDYIVFISQFLELKSKSNFKKVAKQLLNSKTLSYMIEAKSALVDHEKIFLGADITTDIRPVFHSDGEDFCTALTHTLKIHYHIDDAHHVMYLSLDSNDLVSLKKKIEASQRKETVIKERIDKSDLNLII